MKIYFRKIKKFVNCQLSIVNCLSGQSLIEVLVAIGLAAIILPAIITGMISSREGKAQEAQRLAATTLLKEAEEATRNIREKGWANVAVNGTYHPEVSGVSGSQWALVAGSETISGLSRQIVVTDAVRDASGNLVPSGGTVDPSTKQAAISVSWSSPIAAQVTSTIYLQRYLNNAAFTHTSQADFTGGTTNNTVVTSGGTGTAGAVELTQSASTTDYGNKFRVESVSAIGNMTSSAMKTSLRFTAQATKTVSAIRVYLQTEQGISPSYRYGIQTNNPTGNVPTGTWVGNFGTLTATSVGWKTITLGSPAALTAGSTYHLVVEYASGTINTSRYVALRRSAPLNSLYPKTNVADPNANTLFNSGSGWAVQGFQAIYELDYSDGTFEGNPYEGSIFNSVFGANWIGEKFTITISGGNKIANSISFYVAQNSTTEPLDSLQVELRTAANSSLASGVLATAAQTGPTFSYFTFTFTSPITLTNGSSYRIFLKSPGSNATNFYQVYRIFTTNAANFNSITYDDTNSIYTVSTNSGSSWTDTNVNWDIGGFFFTIQSGAGGFATIGDFTSHATGSFDAGGNVAFNYLTWTASVPVATALTLQIAINTDNLTWSYFGPDSTSSTFYTSPSSIPLTKINGRYIRYKAYFTSDGSATPVLSDVSINYSP